MLLHDDFNDGNFQSWVVFDELNTNEGPSIWQVVNGELRQSSNIYGGIPSARLLTSRGTYAYYNHGFSWQDYRFRVRLRGSDDDGLGVMFRYQDNNNYYRFEMDAERNFRRLVKKVNGSYSALYQGSGGYQLHRNYVLEVSVLGNQIRVVLDGEVLFAGTDSSLSQGTIALYNYAQQNAYYDDVWVMAISSLARVGPGGAETLARVSRPWPGALALVQPQLQPWLQQILARWLTNPSTGQPAARLPAGPRLSTSLPLLITTLASSGAGHSQPVIGHRVTTYLHSDGLGSVVAATDASGALLWRKQYAPFGAERSQGGGAPAPERLGYTGHVQDDSTGLTYMRARYYDPHIGRFLSPDPVRFHVQQPMSFNRYDYANNNPYRFVDPDGREARDENDTDTSVSARRQRQSRVQFNFGPGLERLQEAVDAYNMEDTMGLLLGRNHTVNIRFAVAADNQSSNAVMTVLSASEIIVNRNGYSNLGVNRLAWSLDHEMVHVQHFIQGRLNRRSPTFRADLYESEQIAYSRMARMARHYRMGVHSDWAEQQADKFGRCRRNNSLTC